MKAWLFARNHSSMGSSLQFDKEDSQRMLREQPGCLVQNKLQLVGSGCSRSQMHKHNPDFPAVGHRKHLSQAHTRRHFLACLMDWLALSKALLDLMASLVSATSKNRNNQYYQKSTRNRVQLTIPNYKQDQKENTVNNAKKSKDRYSKTERVILTWLALVSITS